MKTTIILLIILISIIGLSVELGKTCEIGCKFGLILGFIGLWFIYETKNKSK